MERNPKIEALNAAGLSLAGTDYGQLVVKSPGMPDPGPSIAAVAQRGALFDTADKIFLLMAQSSDAITDRFHHDAISVEPWFDYYHFDGMTSCSDGT